MGISQIHMSDSIIISRARAHHRHTPQHSNQTLCVLLAILGKMFAALRQRKCWRAGILRVAQPDTPCCHTISAYANGEPPSAAKRRKLLENAHPIAVEEQPDVAEGFRRKQAKIDFATVRCDVEEATSANKWIKQEHGGHIADFLAHLVAASYASPELFAETPAGYDFLPCAFPHPNGEARGRTIIAEDVAANLGPHMKYQIFGIIIWRYHNTAEAWKKIETPSEEVLHRRGHGHATGRHEAHVPG